MTDTASSSPSFTTAPVQQGQLATDSSSDGTLPLDNNNNHTKNDDDSRPAWSSRWTYAAALGSLAVCQFWRGAGIVGGPHHHSNSPTSSVGVVWSMSSLVLCLVVIAGPLVILELGVGQTYILGGIGLWQLPPYCRTTSGGSSTCCRFRRSSSHRGRRGHRRPWTGLGVAGMLVGWCVAAYSVGILAWTCHALCLGDIPGLLDGTTTMNGLGESMVGGGDNSTKTSIATSIATARTGIMAEATGNNNNNNDNEEAIMYGMYPNPMQLKISFRDYFVNTIVGQSTLEQLDLEDNSSMLGPTRLVGPNVFFAGIVWLWVFISTTGGSLRWMERANLLLTGISLILLVVLCLGSWLIPAPPLSYNSDPIAANFRKDGDGTTTSPDATSGTAAQYHYSADVLSTSMIQSLYIAGILTGVLSSYASYAPSIKEPTVQIATVVMMLNLLVLCVTGYAISCALGSVYSENTFMAAYYSDRTVIMDALSTTLFVVLVQWPAALATLPQGAIWVRLVYTVVVLLGLQFPTAIVTAICAVIRDDRTSAVARWQIAGVTCSLGFITSLIFATDAGLIFLDVIDYYLSLALILLGFLESFAAGWVYDLDDQISTFGAAPIVSYMLWNFAPVLTAATIWFGFDASDPGSYQRMWLGLFGAVVTFLFFFAWTFLFIRCSYEEYLMRAYARSGNNGVGDHIMDARSYYMEFCFGNTESLKRALEPAIGPLPQIWYIFIKRVVPHLLLLIFIKRVLLSEYRTSANVAFGNFGGYSMRPYQWTGIILFATIVGLFVLGFVAPQVYAPLAPPPTAVFINRRDTWEDVEDTAEESSEESTTVEEPQIEELAHMEEPIDWEDRDDETEESHADYSRDEAVNGASKSNPATVRISDEHDVHA